MNFDEAVKRLRQETCPNTYNPDFDKEECLKVVESLKSNMIHSLKNWIDLLAKDGKNTKLQVKNEIKAVLEELESGK